MYRKRYTSNLKIGGIYFVQLWYLIVTIVVVALFLNIGLDIIMRPTLDRFPIPSTWIFNAYAVALIITAIGSGIHTSATSVYQSFKSKGKIEKQAYFTNELFHGPLSHNMVYLGAIISTVCLGFLELNHPLPIAGYNFNIIIVVI